MAVILQGLPQKTVFALVTAWTKAGLLQSHRVKVNTNKAAVFVLPGVTLTRCVARCAACFVLKRVLFLMSSCIFFRSRATTDHYRTGVRLCALEEFAAPAIFTGLSRSCFRMRRILKMTK